MGAPGREGREFSRPLRLSQLFEYTVAERLPLVEVMPARPPAARYRCATLALVLHGPLFGLAAARAASDGALTAVPPPAASAARALPTTTPVGAHAARDPPQGSSAPLTTAERLRITLLGGNPLFALDWLAPGLELDELGSGLPRPRLPLP